jgi:hypothetical protein
MVFDLTLPDFPENYFKICGFLKSGLICKIYWSDKIKHPCHSQWFSAALQSGQCRFPPSCLAASFAFVSLRFISWFL